MRCKRCEAEKPEHMFYNNSKSKTGKNLYCKSCCNSQTTDWAARNRDKCRAYTKNWAAKNLEHRKAYDATPERVACRKRNADLRAATGEAKLYAKRYYSELKNTNPVKLLLQGAKNRAKKLGIDFTLTEKNVVIPTHCPVLGIEMKANSGKGKFNSPSIDRIDSSAGYTPDNICVISLRANMLKSDATVEELSSILRYMKRKKKNAKLPNF